jgi:hypothetical protein
MTALNLIMTIINICDGDKSPNLRNRYTLQDMMDAHTLSKYGDNVAEITFFDLKTGKYIR